MKISNKQKEMLAFIEEFVVRNGYPPTYEEIRTGLEISSKSLVNYHLEVLENAALIARSPNTPRGIRLVNESETFKVPFMGAVAVSSPPIFAELQPQDAIELTGDIVPNSKNLCAFKVQGNSMLEALVNEGDIVIMEPQTQAKNGEMVAVQLVKQGQTTLQRYYRENGHVRLQPDNPAMEPIIAAPDDVKIQGRVIAIIRQVD